MLAVSAAPVSDRARARRLLRRGHRDRAATPIASRSSTLVRGARDLVGTVDCVDPKGAPVDSEFSWSYRADSYDYRAVHRRCPRTLPTRRSSPTARSAATSRRSPARASQVAARRSAGSSRSSSRASARLGRQWIARPGAGVLVSNICARGLGGCGTNICVPAASVGRARAPRPSTSAAPTAPALRSTTPSACSWVRRRSTRRPSASSSIPSDYKKFHQHYNEGTNYGWVVSSDKGAPTGKDRAVRSRRSRS